jgi:FKBP-type peptidyl-prolyl cis-trans isomerase SlyD
MIITKNKVVSLHYKLNLENENGQFIEETYGSHPLEFIFGIGSMISGFEKNLDGKKVEDKYKFTLSPEEAYGIINEDDIVNVPIENFADSSGKIDREKIVIGEPIYMTDEHGHQFAGTISNVSLNLVTVDFNHPMAGKTLHFEGEIIAVRDATTSELDHGHVHGDGHEHDH